MIKIFFYFKGDLVVANHPSALKRERQAKRRKQRNRGVLSAVRTAVKRVQTALTEKNQDLAKSALKEATSSLDGAASKGVIPKKRASRKISRLAARVNKFLSAAAAPSS
jgi:small subunit ribosomal protein S20